MPASQPLVLGNSCLLSTLSVSGSGGEVVLVHSGGYHRIKQIGWLIDNKGLFFTVLEAGKSKIKVPVVSASHESLFLPPRHPSSCVLTWWKGQGSSLGSFLLGH